MSFICTFPELYLNHEIRQYGSGQSSFKAVDFPKEKKGEKILHHFYNHCDMIFKKVRCQLSEPSIDFYFNKSLCDGIAIAVQIYILQTMIIILILWTKVLKCCSKMTLLMSFSIYFLVPT